MLIKKLKKEIITIPNLLSLFRLLLIPIYICLYLRAKRPEDYILAASILAVSCLTDLFDGMIARQLNQITTIGKILDPFADKATQFSLIFCLSIKYTVLWRVIILFLIKESFMMIAGYVSFKKGKILKGALLSGKVCTTVIFISLSILVLLPNLQTSIVNTIAIVNILFMLLSFADYAIVYIQGDKNFQPIKR